MHSNLLARVMIVVLFPLLSTREQHSNDFAKNWKKCDFCFFYCVSRVFKAINSGRATCVNICVRPSNHFLQYHCFILISNKADLASFLFCLTFLKCLITGVLKSVFLSCKIYSSMVPLVERAQSVSANPILIDHPSSSSTCRQRPWEVPRREPCRRAVSGVAGTEKWLPLLLC